jgi:hypothetical protein
MEEPIIDIEYIQELKEKEQHKKLPKDLTGVQAKKGRFALLSELEYIAANEPNSKQKWFIEAKRKLIQAKLMSPYLIDDEEEAYIAQLELLKKLYPEGIYYRKKKSSKAKPKRKIIKRCKCK